MANVIAFPLSDRPVASEKDVVPFLNKELVPLVRQIRTALNSTPIVIGADVQAAITAPTDLPTALVAINAIRQVLIEFGLTE